MVMFSLFLSLRQHKPPYASLSLSLGRMVHEVAIPLATVSLFLSFYLSLWTTVFSSSTTTTTQLFGVPMLQHRETSHFPAWPAGLNQLLSHATNWKRQHKSAPAKQGKIRLSEPRTGSGSSSGVGGGGGGGFFSN